MDHTEAVLIEFDPNVISYEDVLLEWSRMHSPNRPRNTQYRSAVWYLSKDQESVAQETLEGMKAASPKVYSDVEPATRFYRAEEYHQDYLEGRSSGKVWL